MEAFELSAKLLLLFLVWALFASPFFVAAFFVGRIVKRRRLNSYAVTVSLAVVVALLVAPVPTPIITFFIPNGFALFTGTYYKDVFSTDGLFSQLQPWIATSLAVTMAVACAVALHYVGVAKKTENKDA
jgi:hypothetical protein